MKKFMVIAVAILASFSIATAQTQVKQAVKQEVKKEVKSALKFTKTTVDLGEIKYRKPATAVFEFVNTGKKPVIITNVRTSCGCTSKSYPKEPIKPGEKSKVEATYNASGSGSITKSVTVRTNEGARPMVLYLKAKVVKEQVKK
ncbi:MAG: DUF1573 domain-containing protein [Flavobacteriaceae bacterium]|nr:DUF1573 domain-containing protein [Flavobacteriaceae bacterium]